MLLTDIENLSRNIGEKQGLHDANIDVKPGSKKGDGFLGDIMMVTATDNDGKKLDLIVKSATQDETVVDKFHIKQVFDNEEHVYRNIFPKLKEFQERKQLPHPFKAFAKYYGSYFDGMTRLIALENLKLKGFELFDKKATVDGEHVEKVFTEYGKFHGVAFVYKQENRELFDKLTSKLHDCWQLFMADQSFVSMLDHVCKDVGSLLEDAKDPTLEQRFKKYQDAAQIFKDVSVCRDKYSTLTHGDCWSNNLMFKYETNADGKKELKDIRILDWQIARIGTPVYDLSYFLYSSASKPIFDKLDYYLKVYHKSLSSTIKQLGHDAEDLYPFHILKSDWMRYARFGYILGLLLQRVKLTYDDDIVDLHDIKDDDGEEAGSKFCSTKYDVERFKERVINLTKHASDIGIL